MRAVLPGKPQAKLLAVSTAQWEGQRLVVYVSANAIIILGSLRDLIQTIYLEECEALDGVTIDAASGKIATWSSNTIYVYKPYGREDGMLKWSLQLSWLESDPETGPSALSWGSQEELLVGSSSLILYQTKESERQIWVRRLPKPAKIAKFSYDAGLIASTGWHDRLVKIWKRQSFGSEGTRFDFTYLAHPAAVTAIHWRKPPPHKHHPHEQSVDDVLFSLCADSKIRIWAATDPHGLQGLQLWGEIDMQQSIQPRRLGDSSDSTERYALFIDNEDFTSAADSALQTRNDEDGSEDHALEHLADVLKARPDVCLVFDCQGYMSAWGIENVGRKEKKSTDIFNIAHIDDLQIPFLLDAASKDKYVCFFGFCTDQISPNFTILSHFFDGRLTWHEARLDELFNPSPCARRLEMKAVLTGHEEVIQKIFRASNGMALVSHANKNECLLWTQNHYRDRRFLQRRSHISCTEHVRGICIFDLDFLVILHSNKISLWNTRFSPASEISCHKLDIKEDLSSLLLLPEEMVRPDTYHIAAITSRFGGSVWEVRLPAGRNYKLANGYNQTPSMTEFCTFEENLQGKGGFIQPIGAPYAAVSTSSIPSHSLKNVVISYTNAGTFQAWAAIVAPKASKVRWHASSLVQTGIAKPSIVSGSPTQQVALVNMAKTGLSIWDTQTALMEYDTVFPSFETITSLCWSSTSRSQAVLAINFPYKVNILTQMRYDHTNIRPAWAPIWEINIKDLTSHPVSDSVWLGSGELVVSAGNQLFVYDEVISMTKNMIVEFDDLPQKDSSSSIHDLATYLNQPLPVYDPQFLSQGILAGDFARIYYVLFVLYKALKYFAQGDELESHLSIDFSSFYVRQEGNSFSLPLNVDEDEDIRFEDLTVSLIENLSKLTLPQLKNSKQVLLANLIECMAGTEKHSRSMDANAMRFYYFFSESQVRESQAYIDRYANNWRESVWAFNSNSQDLLIDVVSQHFNGSMMWEHARYSGMFTWITDLDALRTQFEVIARNEYTRTDDKNPINCSLYYLALRKKNVLIGLWRMATWNREQAGTLRLLKNNFSEGRWKTAALKNAYALLGKRRFEYAAAWFLLAGNLQDAVSVCANQMEDLQLAIAVARVYNGDDNDVLRSLLIDKVLPQAALEGNRWQATWAFWMLGKHDLAIRALTEPLHDLIPLPTPPKRKARSYLAHEPALIVLYKQLRSKYFQATKGAVVMSPRAEWDFVIRTARQYDRMGCPLLAVDLVRNWEFLTPSSKDPGVAKVAPVEEETGKKSRRRSSARLRSPTTPKSPTKEKPKPTMFKEPEPSSLLDSFGF